MSSARAREAGIQTTHSRGRPATERARGWLVLGKAALLAEVQEIVHATPSLGEVLDLRRCDDFIEKVRTGVYQATAHEEVLGGLVAMCFCATTLPHSRGA